MPTIQTSGDLSNREAQVESAYNDPNTGFITLLQKQVDQAAIDSAKANQDLQEANTVMVSLKDNLNTLKGVGVFTGNINPIKSWVWNTVNVNNLALKAVIPAPMVVVANPISEDAAINWIGQAKASIKAIQALYNEFDTATQIGYQPSKDQSTKIIFGHDNIMSVWAATFEKTIADLQGAIQQLRLNVTNFDAAVLAAQAAIDSQETIISNLQAAYIAATNKVVDLNKQMTVLRLQYHTDMSAAQDVNAAVNNAAVQNALISDPAYQQSILDFKEAQLTAATALQQAQITNASNIEQAKIQAEADVQKAQIAADAAAQAAVLGAQTSATATAATAAEQSKADQKRMMVIGAIALVTTLIVGIVIIYIFKKD